MPDARDQLEALQREQGRELTRQMLRNGFLGALLFIGLVGAAPIVLYFTDLWLAALWAGVPLFCAAGLALMNRADPQGRRTALLAATSKRFPQDDLPSQKAREGFAALTDTLASIVVRYEVIVRKAGRQELLAQAVANACAMVAQYFAAVRSAVAPGEVERAMEDTLLRDLQGMQRLLDGYLGLGRTEREALAVQLARESEDALDEMMRLTQSDAASETERLKKVLEAGFAGLKSAEGIKELRKLAAEHDLLQPLLAQKKDTDPLALAQAPALVQQAFWEGLGALSGALTLAQAIQDTNAEQLKAELEEAEREIASLEGDPQKAERRRMAEDRRARRLRLLKHLENQQLGLERLFDGCDQCSTALSDTRLDLADIQARRSEQNAQQVMERLKAAIAQAKAVQDEMKGLGL
ncbi:MAG: hypothetical protein HY681_13435 [Chloroflexi bacterium]|nr:hypothetical protein [Chloroflexota bacterium]